MKVLIVNKFLYPNGGSETYIFKIGQELMRMGHEVQYFGMEHEGRIVGNHAGVYTKPLDFHGGTGGSGFSKLTMPFKILYSEEAKTDIKKVLADFQPDVVHFNNINFQLTPSVIEAVREFELTSGGIPEKEAEQAVRKEMQEAGTVAGNEKKKARSEDKTTDRGASVKPGKRIRIIYTAHDAQWVCPNHLLRIPSTGEICTRCIDGNFSNCAKYRCIHNSRMRSILGEKEAELYQKRGTYRLVDTVISPSQFFADTLAHNPQLRGRIVTMHNFYDGEEMIRDTGETPQYETAAIPEETGVLSYTKEENRPYVLYFGRYTEEKGVRTLLSVCRRLPDIPFVFAGRGDLEEEVNAVANVRNVGFRKGSEIRQLIRDAAFVVFPSEWLENGPFSVIESIMNGTPVLGSRLGGTPELISEGETGELFGAGNAAELEEKIRILYNDRELLKKLYEGCEKTMEGKGSIVLDTLPEYCRKLVSLYSN